MHLSQDDAPVVRDLKNGLLVMYLVDKADRFEYVQGRHLREAGVDRASLDLIAMENLRRFARGRLRLQSAENTRAVFLDGNFEASILLLDDVWDGWTYLTPNGVIVAVPARDILVFADARCDAGIADLRKLVARVTAGGDHLIATSLYRREGVEWVVCEYEGKP
jgi:uncharacterized protein YtpQ (UPF0354 family)